MSVTKWCAALAWPIVCAGLAITVPAFAFQAAPVTNETAQAQTTKAAPCSPVAIRQAVDRKLAPAMVGCRYDNVSGPLMQLHVLPLPSPVYNTATAGLIVGQTPAAGAPATTPLLLLQVSKGPKPQAQTPPAAVSASSPSESVSSSSSSASAQSPNIHSSASGASVASLSVASSTLASSVSSSSSAAASKEGPEFGEAVGTLWSAIQAYPLPAVIALALAALLAAVGLSGKKPKIGVTPRVRCELEPGTSRLISSGPLVLGRKGDA